MAARSAGSAKGDRVRGRVRSQYAIATDGTISRRPFTGLRVSRDGGCTWSTAPVGPGEIWVDASPSGPPVTSGSRRRERRTEQRYRSTDGGDVHRARHVVADGVVEEREGGAVGSAGRLRRGLSGRGRTDGAALPQRPRRRGVDRASVFGEQRDPPTMKFGSTPIVLVAAIDPDDPNIVRSRRSKRIRRRAIVSIARPTAASRSRRCCDHRTDPRRVLRDRRQCLRRDLGSGGYRSTNRGAAFSPLAAPPQLGCLGQRATARSSAAARTGSPTSGRRADDRRRELAEGVSFRRARRPRAMCPGTTVASMCEPLWPSLKELSARRARACARGSRRSAEEADRRRWLVRCRSVVVERPARRRRRRAGLRRRRYKPSRQSCSEAAPRALLHSPVRDPAIRRQHARDLG